MKRKFSRILAVAGVAALAAVGTAAQARGNVAFSVGINSAPAYYGGYAPAYGPAPVYAAPQVYGYGYNEPQPAYVAPQPVYVAPQPVYVAPRPVYVAPPMLSLGFGFGGYYGGHGGGHHGGGHRHWR